MTTGPGSQDREQSGVVQPPRAGEQRLRVALDAMLDPWVLLGAVRDEAGAIIDFVHADANTAACAYNGLPYDELVGARLLDLLPGHVASGLFEQYRHVVGTGEPLALDDLTYEHELLGSVPRHYDVRAVRVGDGLSCSWRDVTERHDAIVRLAESEARYRLIAENASDAVFRGSNEGVAEWFSPSVTALVGWLPEQLVGRPFAEFVHPDDLPRLRAGQAHVLHGEVATYEVRVRTAAGGYRRISITLRPLLDAAGEIVGRAGGWRDIQAEVEAREALAESERTLHIVADFTHDWEWWRAPDGRLLWASPSSERVTGHTAGEFVADRDLLVHIIHPDDRERMRAHYDHWRPPAGDSGEHELEYRITTKDGEERWISHRCTRVVLEDGTDLGIRASNRDTTERKRAEEALLTFKTAVDKANFGVALADRDGLFTYVNAAAAAMHGWAPEELLGRHVSVFHGEEQMERFRELFGRVLHEGGFSSEEVWHARRDGSVFPALMSAARIEGIAGQPGFSSVTMIDITERVRSEQELRRSEERYARAQAIGHLGHWEYDPTSREFRGSAEVVRLCGLDPAAVSYGVDEVESCISERESVHRAFVDLLEHDAPFDLQFEIHPRDGAALRIAWVLAEVQRDEGGSPLLVTGILQDTTADRRADEALRESQEMRDIAEHVAHIGSFKWALGASSSAWSPEIYELFDIEPGEFDGDLLRALEGRVHPNDQERLFQSFARLAELGMMPAEEFRIVRRDGEVRILQGAGTGERGAGGAVTALVGYVQDITERRRAAAEIQQLNAELEERVAERTAELAATNAELEAFAYAVSHDLRAPLRAIDGFSQIVVEDHGEALDDEAHASLQRVRAAAQRMGLLIDALLALSRLSRKGLDVGRVDLSRLAAQVVARLREQDPERHVEARIAPDCKVTSDADLLEVVFTNLLANAWKFTGRRERAHLEFGETSVDGERVFFVRDDGAGFEPAYAGKLFQPFQRLHPADEFPGTGIGLATVRRVVARLGGRCWAEGAVDAGATFFFTLREPPGTS